MFLDIDEVFEFDLFFEDGSIKVGLLWGSNKIGFGKDL